MSSILEASPHSRYYLTPTACRGILRRAAKRGKELPPVLMTALEIQASIPLEVLITWREMSDNRIPAGQFPPVAFACNQRNKVRDLNDLAGAVQAQPGMKQQTFVAAIPNNTQIATRHESLGDGTGIGIGNDGDPTYTILGSHSHAVYTEKCLTPWDTQQARIFTENSIAPTVAGADGGGGRNPAGLVFAAFCAGAGADARSIGYELECSPTLKGSAGGNMMPSVICLMDQGGQRMDVSDDQAGTLRSQMDGHPPIVMATQQGGAEICEGLCPTITSAAGTSGNNQPVLFENYGVDSRYTGPHEVAPTISARAGTGGNNLPLAISAPISYTFNLDSAKSNSMKSSNPKSGCREVDVSRTIDTTVPCPSKNQGGIAVVEETYAIAGNAVDRLPHNGGNGIGYQRDICYTLTGTDKHCVFSQQRSDEYMENSVVSTQTSRQYKDATDLVCEVAGLDLRNGNENDLSGTLQSKTSGGYSLNNLHPIRIGSLVRRLTPGECELLMGFKTGWTNIPGASDSKRYRALGNSVAIPCVEYIMMGIAAVYAEEGGQPHCTFTPTT